MNILLIGEGAYMYLVLTQEDTRFPLYISGAGIQAPEKGVARPQGQEWHQLAFVIQGSGVLETDGKKHDLQTGDCFILKKDYPHTYHPTCEAFQTLWILYDGSAAESLTNLFTDQGGSACFTPPKAELLLAKARAFLSAAEAVPETDRTSPLLYDLFMNTLRQKEKLAPRRVLSQKLAPALAFMTVHLADPLTLQEIAESASLSKFTFCKLFREMYAMTPFAYLMQLRLQHAKNMLSQNRDCTVKEAALSSGFRDVSYFGAAFRRFENMTPKSFQQQFGSADR